MRPAKQKLVACMLSLLLLHANPMSAMRTIAAFSASQQVQVSMQEFRRAVFEDHINDTGDIGDGLSCPLHQKAFERAAYKIKTASAKIKSPGHTYSLKVTMAILKIRTLTKIVSSATKKGCDMHGVHVNALQALQDVAMDGIREAPCFHKTESFFQDTRKPTDPGQDPFEVMGVLLSKDCKPVERHKILDRDLGADKTAQATPNRSSPMTEQEFVVAEAIAEKEADEVAFQLADQAIKGSALLHIDATLDLASGVHVSDGSGVATVAIGVLAWITLGLVVCSVVPLFFHLLHIAFCLLTNIISLLIYAFSLGHVNWVDLGMCLKWSVSANALPGVGLGTSATTKDLDVRYGQQACTDIVPSGRSRWVDPFGNDCASYDTNNMCEQYGNDDSKYSNDGYTSSQACCGCGGGQATNAELPLKLELLDDDHAIDDDPSETQKTLASEQAKKDYRSAFSNWFGNCFAYVLVAPVVAIFPGDDD